MTFYVLADKTGAIVQGPIKRDKRPDDLPQKGWRWFPVVDDPPSFDPGTQRLSHVGWTIAADKATKVYEVKNRHADPLTTEERLSAIEARLDALEAK